MEVLSAGGRLMKMYDAAGHRVTSGERFRLRAAQGDLLIIHVFGVQAADGSRGSGAYTLDIDVLPQLVSVQAQPLLPGTDGKPGGPTSSLTLVFQGDRLNASTAEDPKNYTVTWLGPDGIAGTADDQPIPLTCTLTDGCIVYNPEANVEVSSGRTYPTAVRQTV